MFQMDTFVKMENTNKLLIIKIWIHGFLYGESESEKKKSFENKRNYPQFIEKKRLIKKKLKYNRLNFEILWMETQRYHLSDFEALFGFNILGTLC